MELNHSTIFAALASFGAVGMLQSYRGRFSPSGLFAFSGNTTDGFLNVRKDAGTSKDNAIAQMESAGRGSKT